MSRAFSRSPSSILVIVAVLQLRSYFVIVIIIINIYHTIVELRM